MVLAAGSSARQPKKKKADKPNCETDCTTQPASSTNCSTTHQEPYPNSTTGDEVRQLPVPEIDLSKDKPEYKKMIVLVDRMLALNEELGEIGDKRTDKRQQVEEATKKTDTDIDQLIYDLYAIAQEEKEVIEASLR